MKIPPLLATVAVLASLATPALAQSQGTTQVTTSPGKGTATHTRVLTATVTEVDAAKGHVTLKTAKGEMLPLQVGSDVRNLDKVAVGDQVKVRYEQSLTVSLKKDGKDVVAATSSGGLARAPGNRPGGVVAEQVEVTADVVALDAKKQLVTLKGPQRTVEMWIEDPKQFKLVKVGDQVQAVYTEAVALSVEPVKPKK